MLHRPGLVAHLLAACLLASVIAPRAAAEPRPRVAILELVVDGEAPRELRVGLERSLTGGLYSGGYEVVAREEVARKLGEARQLIGCTTSTCLARVGELVGAQRFVQARVEVAGAAYTIELTLFGADVAGGVIARAERACPVCTIGEANDAISRAAAELRATATPKVKLAVTTQPDGADIEIDGSAAGKAPLEAALSPGEHVVRAALAGHAKAERIVTVEPQPAGASQELAIPLVRAVATLPTEGRHGAGGDVSAAAAAGVGPRFATWKWAVGGAAAAALVSGIVLVALDDNGADCPDPGAAECRTLYGTMAGGLTLMGLSVVGGGATGWMFWQDRRVGDAGGGSAPVLSAHR